MNFEKGQLVQVRFCNGFFFDAIIENWSDTKSLLRLPNSDDTILIQDTARDVLLVRTLNQSKKDKQEILNQFENLAEEAPKNIEEIAELKKELNKLEREEIFSKKFSHEGSGIKQVNYGLPQSGIKEHTSDQIATKNNGFNSSLQRMFRKKH